MAKIVYVGYNDTVIRAAFDCNSLDTVDDMDSIAIWRSHEQPIYVRLKELEILGGREGVTETLNKFKD